MNRFQFDNIDLDITKQRREQALTMRYGGPGTFSKRKDAPKSGKKWLADLHRKQRRLAPEA